MELRIKSRSTSEVRSPKNKRSRRSFNAKYQTCYNATYLSSKRIGPAPKKVDFNQFQNPVVHVECNMNDSVCVFELGFSTKANYTKLARI